MSPDQRDRTRKRIKTVPTEKLEKGMKQLAISSRLSTNWVTLPRNTN